MAQDKKVEQITSMEDDFAQWYTDICKKAELIDYSSVKGFMILRPYGYAIWENIQRIMDGEFKKTGHENVAMPVLIPESLLKKEGELVNGFAPEVAWVTMGGSEKLEERLAFRPTSETMFCDHWSRVLQTYRQLPMLYNQWCSVIRWEKTTRPFLRSREFWWQEGHTIHETAAEAEAETEQQLNCYADVCKNALAMPVVKGRKTDKEKFAGAEATYTIEAMMKDRKALQSGTSHYFGDKFSRAYDVAFTGQDSEGEGSARRFLLSGRNGRVDTIRYYNEKTGTYYRGQIRESDLTLPEAQEGLTPIGGQLAFENEALAESLDPNTLVLPKAPVCPVYTVTNPLAAWDSETRNELLESLDFNLRAAAVYQATDGLVVQEGSDTLRIQKSGKLTFHAAESGPARFQALSAREKDLQLQAERILNTVAQPRLGEGRLVCQAVETQEDGSVVLNYACLLGGSQVQLWDEGWLAKFVFEGTNLSSFVICLRTYTKTEQTSQALPVRQAAAALSAMGQAGKDLQLSYLDDGSTDMLTTQWTVRERT